MFKKVIEIVILTGPHEIVVLTLFGVSVMLWGVILHSILSACPG